MTNQSYDVAFAKHENVDAGSVDTVTLGWNSRQVEVVNWGTSGRIYWTVDGSEPTPGRDNTYVSGPGGGAYRVDCHGAGKTVVKLTCVSASDYSVTGF